MNKALKIALIVVLAVYVFSPVDAMLGPADDAILLLCALALNKYSNRRKQQRLLEEKKASEEIFDEEQ